MKSPKSNQNRGRAGADARALITRAVAAEMKAERARKTARAAKAKFKAARKAFKQAKKAARRARKAAASAFEVKAKRPAQPVNAGVKTASRIPAVKAKTKRRADKASVAGATPTDGSVATPVLPPSVEPGPAAPPVSQV
jgi:hypothetical protein